MKNIYHLNCVDIDSPMGAKAIGHCLLLEEEQGLILIDAGIGLLDIRDPEGRLGTPMIEKAGFKFDEQLTAYRQIEQLGFRPEEVKHCIITHLDCDHIGAVADFPHMELHVAKEEYDNFYSGNPRYLLHQLAHEPAIHIYSTSSEKWFGLEARKVVTGFDTEIFLVPLPGHSLGHSGVAIRTNNGWLFHIGDAYYYRVETVTDDHPVAQLAARNADNNELRIQSLEAIKQLMNDHPEITIFSFHDPAEFPGV